MNFAASAVAAAPSPEAVFWSGISLIHMTHDETTRLSRVYIICGFHLLNVLASAVRILKLERYRED